MESKSADDAPPLPEFDVVTCSSVVRLPHDMPIEACTLSADARTFYSATMDGNVCATWVQAGREKRTFGVDGMLSTGVVWASDLLLCEPLLMVAGAVELGLDGGGGASPGAGDVLLGATIAPAITRKTFMPAVVSFLKGALVR